MIINIDPLHNFIWMELDIVEVVSDSIWFDDSSQKPGLLAETLKNNELIFYDKIILSNRKWIVGIEEGNFT